MLPSVNQTRTSCSIEYSCCAMALCEIAKNIVVHSWGCKVAYSVWKCMAEGAVTGIKIMH